MCYAVYLSTDSAADLTECSSCLLHFERLQDASAEPIACLLPFSNCWYVGSKSGCSCTFRHLYSVELGFGEPVEWYPEEQDAIDAMKALYEIIASLLSGGYSVELIDAWEDVKTDDIRQLDISLDEVTAKSFRLLENYHFSFECP